MSKSSQWFLSLQEAGKLPTPDDSDYELMEQEELNQFNNLVKTNQNEQRNENIKTTELSVK